MVTLELEYLHEIDRLRVRAESVVRSLHRQLGLRVCELPFSEVIGGAVGQRWTRDPFDRVIVAQASVAGRALVTRDNTIQQHYRRALW